MFSFKKKTVVPEVVNVVASHIVSELQSPYICEYSGNISYKIEKEPAISKEKAAIFKQAVLKTVSSLLGNSGYTQIKGDGKIMTSLLEEYDISQSNRLAGDIWFIEDNKDAYFYSEGMNGAKRI